MTIPAQRAHLRLLEGGMLPRRLHQCRRPPEPVINSGFRARARHLVIVEGKSFTEAAEMLRVHRQTVRNIVGAEGDNRPRQRRTFTC